VNGEQAEFADGALGCCHGGLGAENTGPAPRARRAGKSSTGKTSTARTRRTASRSTNSVPELPGISTVRQQCAQLHLAGGETGTQAAIQDCE
jgi:hypothetical protein